MSLYALSCCLRQRESAYNNVRTHFIARDVMHIRAVLGPIAPEDLGFTLGHEHLLVDMRGLWDNPPPERAYLVDQEPTLENLGALVRNPYDSKPNLLNNDPELSINELQYYREAGGQGLIDMTTVGIKPDPEGLCNISR